jgi:hypothetical protein
MHMSEPPFGHEAPGVDVRRILAVGAVLAGGVTVTIAAVGLTLASGLAPTPARSIPPAALIPPAPRLETHPTEDLARLRARQRSTLERWSWTDRSAQFAQIPIERAMALYAERERAISAVVGAVPASGPTP